MTRNQLDDLIAQGEGTRLEFKRSISAAHRIARTLVAFANTSGGTLLIGVADNKTITGVLSESREMLRIEEATDRLAEPALSVTYETLTADGRKVLIVNVEESIEKPHFALDETGKKTIYVRAKDKSVPTNKLIIASATLLSRDLLKLPATRILIQYLRKTDAITADKFAKLINVSDYRAGKILRELADTGLLLPIDKQRPVRYALKLAE